ncbi:hypothetical protein [Ensifer sesbaniae]|uniref:hypothetical protein n=1 Tax=Ensifer sesbaniae TaxID=1214071 RepID=UPI00156A18B0|nr:hypothetical protein [Ensifer sesbaniae]NRQ17694.1 hypothetical protein [Ensifer sesbaniae]
MGHEKRIVEAFSENQIQRVLLIDDVYDMPEFDEISGELLEFMGSIDGQEACKDAGVNDADLADTTDAIDRNDVGSEAVASTMRALYAKFVETRDPRFDPGKRFETRKGLTLALLDPLIALLRKCGENVAIELSGLEDGEERFVQFKPQIVFLDYYLSPDATGEALKPAVKTKARKASIQLLNRLLKTKPEEDPAVVLMSSEEVKDKAQSFRQDVESLGENVIALRFRFLRKGWVGFNGNDLTINNEAADTLLDTSQGYVFGQVVHRALKEWRSGAESALREVLKQIGSLEPKDFAYLFRFRLATEGEKMGEYLEWLFGENLRGVVAETVNWSSESFTRIDDSKLSKGIEGAFDGPSVPIARLFHRVRVDERPQVDGARRRLGDMFIKPSEKKVMVVITPDCDLVPRGTGPKVKRLLTMDGELRPFDQENASADQFIFYKKKPYSLKWNPKALHTFPVSGSGSLGVLKGVEYLGTLRPLYAQEVQRLALTDLARLGLSVAPTMGVDAEITVHLRVKNGNGTATQILDMPGSSIATVLPERGDLQKGHRVLLRRSFIHTLVEKLREVDPATLTPEDAAKLSDFLREKNEDQMINGFLIKGAATKEKGPLSTTIKIASKPDRDKDAAWLQFTLKLSEEAMEELLSVDPSMMISEELNEPAAEPE